MNHVLSSLIKPRRLLGTLMATAGFASMLVCDAHAGAIVNGFGVGKVISGSWPAGVAVAPPSPYPDSDSGLAAHISILPGVYATLDPATTYGAAIGVGWSIVFVNKPKGGDSVLMDPYAIFPLVTPQLVNPSATLQISGTILSPSSVEFSGYWTGDAGTLQTLSFFDVSNPLSPVELVPKMYFWGSGSGGSPQALNFVISGITNISGTDAELMTNLQVEGDSVAASIPEASSLVLAALGALAFFGSRRMYARRGS